jgi:hypothetical protein
MAVSRQLGGPKVTTEPRMPPFGVAEALIGDNVALTQHGDLFRFWLLTHASANCVTGPAFWSTAVLRECLPNPTDELHFEAEMPPERIFPRTALVRVTLDEELAQ